MVPGVPNARSPVDRFFQFSLLGLLTSGYLAVVGSGYLDVPTMGATAAALLIRALLVADLWTIRFSPALVTAATLAYFGFYPLDYFYLSKSFIPATVHLVFFVAVVKILTATTERDYLYLKVIAFLELLAASLLSASLNFFLFLILFLLLAVATFASSEIRRSSQRHTPARVSARGLAPRLSVVAVFVSAAILCITAGLFFFLPRTARAAFQHFISHSDHLQGFSNQVTLGQIGEIKRENTPVMHVRMDRPEDRYLALKWRGAALADFDGRSWSNRFTPGDTLRPDPSGLLWLVGQSQRHEEERHISYAVHLNEIAADALFFAGTPQFLRIDSLVVRYPSENYRLRSSEVQGVSYQVYSRLEPPNMDSFSENAEPLPPKQREMYLHLPPLDARIPSLARRIVAYELSPAEQARALEKYLRTRFGYTLELPQSEPADPLAYFLFDRRKGHCEYFASSMAVMLRTIAIPSRVITGFQSGVYNPVSGWQLIRASDAHSWVEAYLPYRGWTTFDPTPPDPNPPALSLWTRLGFYTDAAEVFWQDWVLNYNLDRQLQLASRMEESSRHMRTGWFDETGTMLTDAKNRAVESARRFGSGILVALVVLALLWQFGSEARAWWNSRLRALKVQRGEAQASDATILYARMLKVLRRRGIEKPAWLTPMEFVRVLPEPDLLLLVEEITSAYNEVRFGGRAEAASRMMQLLLRLESQGA
jgi:transglutaminase-like putative cysteine protease